MGFESSLMVFVARGTVVIGDDLERRDVAVARLEYDGTPRRKPRTLWEGPPGAAPCQAWRRAWTSLVRCLAISAPMPRVPSYKDVSARRVSASSVPSSTMRPAYITAMRSALCSTRLRSCVMRRSESLRSSFNRPRSSRICAWSVASRAVVGSSAITSSGSQEIAMAINTRCFMLPAELVRIVPRSGRGVGYLNFGQELDRPVFGRASRKTEVRPERLGRADRPPSGRG